MTIKLFSAALTLFLIMDPIGNLPVFVSYLRDVKESRRTWVVARECVIALAVLMAFLLFGPMLMELLQVSKASLYISGGVLLFLVSVGMIFPTPGHFGVPAENETENEPFIVPLAVPLVAGPSTMATIMVFSSSQQVQFGLLIAALVAAWCVTTMILMLSPSICRLLGPRGLRASERLMGMVLTVVAVQMFLDGVREFLRRAS